MRRVLTYPGHRAAWAAGIVLGLGTLSCGDDSSGPTAVAHTHSVIIVEGEFGISANSWGAIQVNVTTSMGSPRVTASFTVLGGAGDRIRVLVMAEAEAVNWSNGQAFTALYDSGQITMASFDAEVGFGRHYVVFDNSSNASSRDVAIRVGLAWDG